MSAALSGDLTPILSELGLDSGSGCERKETLRRKDPAEVYGDGVKSVITGFGFLAVSMALFFTGVAGGQKWWWAMLFPAFFAFAKGMSDILKSRKIIEARRVSAFAQPTWNSLGPDQASPQLRSAPAGGFAPDSRYRTGDLVPPSVTDGTTRHLEMNTEAETMTLPRK